MPPSPRAASLATPSPFRQTFFLDPDTAVGRSLLLWEGTDTGTVPQRPAKECPGYAH